MKRLLQGLTFTSAAIVFFAFAGVANAQTSVDVLDSGYNVISNPETIPADTIVDYYFESADIPDEHNIVSVEITGVDVGEDVTLYVSGNGFFNCDTVAQGPGVNQICKIGYPYNGNTYWHIEVENNDTADSAEVNILVSYVSTYLGSLATSPLETTVDVLDCYNPVEYYFDDLPDGVDAVITLGDTTGNMYMDVYDAGNQYVFDENEDQILYLNNTNDTTDSYEYYMYFEDYECTGGLNDESIKIEYTTPSVWPVELTDGVTSSPIIDVDFSEVVTYYFDLNLMQTGKTLTVETTGASGNVQLYVYDPNGTPICDPADSDEGGYAANEICEILETSETGIYSFKVETFGSNEDVEDFSITATVSDPPPTTDILNGEIVASGSVSDGDYEFYKINLPINPTNLTITTTNDVGSSGTSLDLYEQLGSKPTKIIYHNASENGGTNEEEITFDPASGDHYISLYANGGDFDAVNVRASYVNDALSKGVNKTVGDVPTNEWKFYTINVPSGASDLEISTTGDVPGDTDLFVKFDGYPSSADNDDLSETEGTCTESISIGSPSAGKYYIGIRGISAATGVVLNADYTLSTPTLINGIKETNIDVAANTYKYYLIDDTNGGGNLFVRMDNDGVEDRNADLYYKYDGTPTISDYDESAGNWGTGANTEEILLRYPSAGLNFFGIYAQNAAPWWYGDANDVNLEARWTIADLVKNTPVTAATTNDGEWAYYYLEIENPINSISDLVITTTDTDNDGDIGLYVSQGDYLAENWTDFPTVALNDYKSELGSENNETVTIASPVDLAGYGEYVIGIHSDTQFSGVDLKADWVVTNDRWATNTIEGSPSPSAIEMERDVNGDYMILNTGGIYKRNGTNWDLNTSINSGEDVAISGDKAVVSSGSGTIYTYLRNVGGTWDIASPNLTAGANFGDRLDVDGNYLVVSSNDIAAQDDEPGSAVYVYEWNTDHWDTGTRKTLTDSGGGAGTGENFGQSVAISENTVVVGAPHFSTSMNPWNNTGKVYLFDITDFNAITSQEFEPQEPHFGGENRFGDGVEIDGDWAIVSAYYGMSENFISGTGPGTIEVYYNNAGTWEYHQEIENPYANNESSTGGDGFARDRGLSISMDRIIGTASNWENQYHGGTWGHLVIFKRDGGAPIGSQWTVDLLYRSEFESDTSYRAAAIHGNDYFAGVGNSGSGPGIILFGPSGGGGGGGGVPEFSDYMIIMTIITAIAFMAKKLPKISGTPMTRA